MRPLRKLKAIIRVVRRQSAAFPPVKEPRFLVVSPGGVGTTFLIKYLAGFVATNAHDDRDGLKHWPRPPTGDALAKLPPILFVTGNPDTIVASIARRGWLTEQSSKLGSLAGTLRIRDAESGAFRKAVVAQMMAWTSCKSDRILVIDYDELWDRKAEIARHAGIDEADFSAGFPAREARSSA